MALRCRTSTGRSSPPPSHRTSPDPPSPVVGVKDLPAGIAPQPLHLEYRCFQRCVPHKPHQRCRIFLAVYFSLTALWATSPVWSVACVTGNPGGAAKRRGAMASMTGRSRLAGLPAYAGAVSCARTELVFSVFRFRTSSLPWRGARFLASAFRFAQRRPHAAIDDLVQSSRLTSIRRRIVITG